MPVAEMINLKFSASVNISWQSQNEPDFVELHLSLLRQRREAHCIWPKYLWVLKPFQYCPTKWSQFPQTVLRYYQKMKQLITYLPKDKLRRKPAISMMKTKTKTKNIDGSQQSWIMVAVTTSFQSLPMAMKSSYWRKIRWLLNSNLNNNEVQKGEDPEAYLTGLQMIDLPPGRRIPEICPSSWGWAVPYNPAVQQKSWIRFLKH